MLGLYFAGHTVQFKDFNLLFNRHNGKWAEFLSFLSQFAAGVGGGAGVDKTRNDLCVSPPANYNLLFINNTVKSVN